MGAFHDVLLACFVQLSFLSVCIVEESLVTSSILQTNILTHFICLCIDLTISVWRVPLRFLSCTGLYDVDFLTRFRAQALSRLHAMGVHPDLATGASPQITQALESASRLEQEKGNLEKNMARIQWKLGRYRTDMSKLRRMNTSLETDLAGVRSEHTSLLETIEKIRESNGTISEDQAEKLALRSDLAKLQVALRESESHLASKTKQIAAAVAEKDRVQTLYTTSQQQVSHHQEVATHWESEYKEVCKDRETRSKAYQKREASLRQHFVDHNLKHIQAIRKLLSFLLILWRFSYVLRARANNASTGCESSRSVLKHLTNRKIEVGREKLRALAENIDLKEQLQKTTESQSEDALIAKYRHEQYKFAIKLCQDAAVKFKDYRQYALSRYSQTSTKLLLGLLVLWRFNLVLAKELTEAKAVITALETTAQDTVEADLKPLMTPTTTSIFLPLTSLVFRVQLDYRRFVESCTQAASSQVDNTENEELVASLEELQSAYDGLITEHNASLVSLEKSRADIQDRDQSLDELQKQYELLEGRRITLENDLQGTREELEKSNTGMQEALIQVSTLGSEKEKITQELQNKTLVCEALNKQLQEKDAAVSRIRVQRNTFQDEVTSLRRSSNKMQADLTHLFNNFRATEQKLHVSETEIGRLIRQLMEAEEVNRSVRQSQKQAEETLQIREAENQIITAEMQKEKEGRRLLETLYAASSQKVCDANETIRSLRDALGLAKRSTSEVETRISKLNKEIDTLRATLVQSQNAVSCVQRDLDDVQRSRKDLVEQLVDSSETQTFYDGRSCFCLLRSQEREPNSLGRSKEGFPTTRTITF
ncbi:hypothetical protein QCA50_010553 [Cerrena zonata]|uniref:Uncharacterized protein n=1 Tax=Cerrena zonata TaxID=2478898 RepID=A0AAW0G4Q0_9APHY